MIVENAGAAGSSHGVGREARPTCHTLLFISGAFTAHPQSRRTDYDPCAFHGSVVLTTPSSWGESDADAAIGLIAAAKKNPRKLNYGSVGTGSVFHLAAELFGSMTGTEMTHIPFKGGAEPNTELIAGRLDVIFTTVTTAYAQVEAKRLRALAVASLQPAPQFECAHARADRARLRSHVVQRDRLAARNATCDRVPSSRSACRASAARNPQAPDRTGQRRSPEHTRGMTAKVAGEIRKMAENRRRAEHRRAVGGKDGVRSTQPRRQLLQNVYPV